MNKNIFENITNCKQSLESVKKTLLAEINENMSKGIFDVPLSYQKLIKFSNDSVEFLNAYLADDSNFENDAVSHEDTPLEATAGPVELREADEKINLSELNSLLDKDNTGDPVEEESQPVIEETLDNVEEISDVIEEVPEAEAIIPETIDEIPAKENDIIIPIVETEAEESAAETDTDSVIEAIEEQEDKVQPEPVVETPVIQKAQIIGAPIATKVEIDTHPFDSICFNERRLPNNKFIFEQQLLSISRGGSREKHEVFIYIAPLVLKENSSNVPIIVHAYCEGRQITASSYDTRGNAKSIVQIEINDFHLLCRGSFTNGKFKSYVFTTGISSDQGDDLKVLSSETGADSITDVNSVGHLKFREDDSLFEVFPISMTDNEYVIISVTREFIDYEVVASNYGTTRPRFNVSGVERELIAYHEGDDFIAELI